MFMFLYVFILSHCPGFLLFPKEGACGCWAKFHPLFGRSLFSARWSIWTRGAPRFGPASRTRWEHVEFSRQHDSSCWELYKIMLFHHDSDSCNTSCLSSANLPTLKQEQISLVYSTLGTRRFRYSMAQQYQGSACLQHFADQLPSS